MRVRASVIVATGVSAVDVVRSPRREVVVGPPGRDLALRSRFARGTVERAMACQGDRAHLSRREPAPVAAGNLHVPAEGTGSVHGGWHGRRRTAIRRVASAAVVTRAIAGGLGRAPRSRR